MYICLCKSEPNRDDPYAKNGYSALCPKHRHLAGTKKSYEEMEEFVIEIQNIEQIREKY